MNTSVKTAQIASNGKVNIIDNLIKTSSEGDIVVKMRACGICGSDLEKVFGNYGMLSSRLGHEPSGEIISVGKDVSSNLKVGDRVFVHHHVSCNSCHYCRHGDFTMCSSYQKSNLNPCGLAEKFIVPRWNVERGGVIKIPENLSFEIASLIEPVACCLRALNKINIYSGDDVVVFGAGPVGIMLVCLLKIYGAGNIFLVDINDFRLNFAKKNINNVQTINMTKYIHNNDIEEFITMIKNNTNQLGVDLSIVATSSLKAFHNSLEITRKGGKIMLFGVPPKNTIFSYDLSKIYSNELSIFTSYAASEIETNQALKLFKEKRLDLDFLITHKFDLIQSNEAMQCAHQAKDCMKIIITNKN